MNCSVGQLFSQARSNPSRAQRGFTLIEALASIVVLAVIGTLASNLLLTATEGYQSAAARSAIHAEATMTLDRIARELRAIPPNPASTTRSPNIQQVSSHAIRWENQEGEASLELMGSEIMLAVGDGVPIPLQSDVSGFSIRAYDESNAAMAVTLNGVACEPIRRIEIALTVSRYGVSDMLRTRVFIRSMMAGGS